MRSIILTDEQHKELVDILYSFTDNLVVSEPLWREIMDIKCCKTCKCGNMDDAVCEDTGVPIPSEPGFVEGPDIYPLFCWRKK